MSGLLSIALTGIGAAQSGLTTTSHNIANAGVTGYNRQQIIQGTNEPLSTGVGFIGQGTNVATVRRVYDQFLQNQVLGAESNYSEYDTYSSQISQVDNLLADDSAGLSGTLQDFFKGIQQTANAPNSIPSRQSMLSASDALVSRFHGLYDRLEEIRSGVEGQIKSTVASVNDLSSQIAALNQRIMVVQSADGQAANDLLDQRDKLVSDLNKLIKVSVSHTADGKVNVFVGNGQPVVVGSDSFELGAAPSQEDASKLAVGFTLTKNPLTIQEIPDHLITGGTIAGLLEFRSQALDSAENALGKVAVGLVSSFNAQHRLGQDLNGNLGLDYFTPLAVDVTNLSNSSTGLASTATITASVVNLGQLQAEDYVLTYDGTNYTTTRKSDGATVASVAAPAATMTVDGVTFSGLGTMVSGDRILIQPTRNAAGNISVALTDPRLIAAAAPISTAATNTNTGTGKISAGSVNSVASGIPLAGNITLTFNAATNQFTVAGATPATVAFNPTTNATGLNITLTNPDISFTLSGVPNTGDSFVISNNVSGVSDNRNALLLAGLQSKKILDSSGASFEYSYSQMVSNIGTLAHSAASNLSAQDTLLSEAKAKQQSVSGVNLDEEAANLIHYQQAYQASAKVLTIASQLFNQILSIGG